MLNDRDPERARVRTEASMPVTTPSWATAEGLPYPLGVSRCPEDDAYNFALY